MAEIGSGGRRKVKAAVGCLVFLVLAPGVVAGLIPWWLTGWDAQEPLGYWLPLRLAGLTLLAAGVVVLVQSYARFVLEGLGTPAPVAPTEQLVIGGPYRYVRNPMYLAVAATILGQALVLGQLILVPYAVAFGAAVAAFVHWYEEPTLRRQFGGQYEAYRRAVPAWWPRRKAMGRERRGRLVVQEARQTSPMEAALIEVDRENLWQKVQRGDHFVLVDALSPISFAGAHLPGAVNIPPPTVDDLAERRIPELDTEVVVYCANPGCESSIEVAARLLELGYQNVFHYPGGKQDWREAGLPLEGGRV